MLLVAVGGLLLPIFGLWLVHLGHFGYGAGWVDASIGLYAVALVFGAIGGPRPKRARLLAIRLAEQEAPVSEELRALLGDHLSRAVNYGSLLLVLAILVLMVFKPWPLAPRDPAFRLSEAANKGKHWSTRRRSARALELS